MKFLSVLSALVAATVAVNVNAPLPVPRSTSSLSDIKNGTFTQYLDHEHPEKGTFEQHYWWNAKWFQGPGSPVILYTPGEQNASSSVGTLKNDSLPGYLAQELGGAAILIEHRYWGDSAPYKHMNAETLQYLTVKQTIADFVHFAKTVDLEFDEDHKSNADKSPWIITGASYSGALSAWIEKTAPGTFWAYHASSAPVEAIYDYSQYFLPIKEGLPKNCSTDIGRVINFIDAVYESGDDASVQEIKDLFGLGELKYFNDFASAISSILGVWQTEDLSTGKHEYSAINEFCDAIENVNNKTTTLPGAEGVGLEKALQGYATYYKNEILPTACQDEDEPISVYCLDTHDLTNPMYEDSGETREERLWQWMLCNDNLFYWQTGNEKISLVSQTITSDYYQRQCSLYFPPVNGFTFNSAQNRSTSPMNTWTSGWDDTNTTRLIWVNGQFDPWREAGVSAVSRPGGPLRSTAQAPVLVVPGGHHGSDMTLANAEVNKGAKAVIDTITVQMKAWVGEFYYADN